MATYFCGAKWEVTLLDKEWASFIHFSLKHADFNTCSSYKKFPGSVNYCIWKLISSSISKEKSKLVGYNFSN